ncbi:MAG: cupin domain-containing protein [Parachlamydiaceae bacterium]|nr:cupin domain-containing protein [Parachlamydiaceae bacterium]
MTHLFHLKDTPPQKIRSGGFRIDGNADQFPVLSKLALSLLELHPKAFREPHWHPNANELSYCVDGVGIMTIFGPGNTHDTFTIARGDIVFVPKGSLHHIENIGDGPLQLLICFDNERPEDLELTSLVETMPAHILGATFHQKPEFFQTLQHAKAENFIRMRLEASKPTLGMLTNRYKFNLEAHLPQLANEGGWVKMSNNFLFHALDGLAIYSLVLKAGGAREPHWHPNAAELNYLLQGAARITLVSPNGDVETFDMKVGDMSFMPQGYLHHIENLGKEDARFAIFFNHEAPSDIGASGCMGAYSNGLLSTMFGVADNYFTKMPKFQQDLFIVSRD